MTDLDPGLSLELSAAELETTREHITRFIADKADAAGVDRAVLGLSGGIDSTLTAYLTVEALGANALHGLVMPSTVSRDDNMSDAERVAEDLGIEYDVIAVDQFVDQVLDAVPAVEPDDVGADDPSLRNAIGNVRARSRAVLSYFVANREDALVMGTGNRTEALVGYFTKYGDGAVDCLPIGDLYKQQVRQLAAHVGVPQRLVEKTPTAGLWTGQTDEGELGMGYDTLDAILALTVDGPLSPTAAAAQLDGVTEADVDRIHELHERSAHKRSVPPSPGPAV